jgi:hypothetical protein
MSTTAPTSDYLLLLRGTHWHQSLSAEEIQKKLERFASWFERLTSEGKIKSARPLLHTGRIVTGKSAVMDGPFAESKEAIAGFFIIQAGSLEEAVEIAKQCPALDYGQTVEVRPIALEPGEITSARERARSRTASIGAGQ